MDWIQLSGDESLNYCQQITKPVIKAVKIDSFDYRSAEDITENLSVIAKALLPKTFIFLLDSYIDNKYGGMGETFDWKLAKLAVKYFPIVIAGGLNPQNVSQVIREIAPWGVDISSGVETNGVKDILKIKKLIESVRKADAS